MIFLFYLILLHCKCQCFSTDFHVMDEYFFGGKYKFYVSFSALKKNLAFSFSRWFVCFPYCVCFHWRCRSNNFVQLAYCTKCHSFANIHMNEMNVCHLAEHWTHILYIYIYLLCEQFFFAIFSSYYLLFCFRHPKFLLCLRLELNLWNGSTTFILPRSFNMTS